MVEALMVTFEFASRLNASFKTMFISKFFLFEIINKYLLLKK